MAESFSLKDQLFNQAKVERISLEIQQVYPDFEADAFSREVLAAFPNLELKARILWISECLQRYLPAEFRQAVGILLAALPPACDPSLSDDDFGEFIYAPYSEFVSRYGCTDKDLDFSLAALKAITTRFSAENAIRPFLNAYPEQTLAAMTDWSRDSHYHVRRLASEGTRPKLPWAPGIRIPPRDAVPILTQLHADQTRFVTRSVTNHLNDLSKSDPELVLDLLSQWHELGLQREAELAYMTRHALRSQIKQGHAATLKFLGYAEAPRIGLSRFELESDVVRIGDSLEFSLELEAEASARLVVDYRIYFRGKKGDLRPKVFKLKSLDLQAGQCVLMRKRHALRQMSTRQLNPGEHRLELQINGQAFGSKRFLLEV